LRIRSIYSFNAIANLVTAIHALIGAPVATIVFGLAAVGFAAIVSFANGLDGDVWRRGQL